MSEPKHFLYRGIIFSILFAIWAVFSGLYDVFHLSLGVISCGLVTWMVGDLVFENRTTPLGARFVQAWRITGYAFWLLWQIVLANFDVLRLAFAPKEALQLQIVKYETKLESDFEKFLLANSITLTPGTVTVKILGNDFYIHAISDQAAAGLDGEMERRIAAIFAERGEKEPLAAS